MRQGQERQSGTTTDTHGLLRRLRGGGMWVVAGRTLGMATVLATYVYLARLVDADVLDTTEFAAYVLVASVVSFLSMAAMFGLNTLICRYISESFGSDHPDRARDAMSLTIRLGAISVGQVGALAWLILKLVGDVVFQMPLVSEYSGLIACWIMLLAISQILAEAFRGLHDLRAASLLCGVSGGLAANAIFLLSLVAVTSFVQPDFQLLVVVLALSLLLSNTLAAIHLYRVWPRTNEPSTSASESHLESLKLKTVVSEAWPVMLVQLFGFGMAQLDIWVVAVWCSPAELAVYGVIRRVSLLVAVPLTQVSLAVSSSIAELYARQDWRNLQRVVRGAATVGAVAAGLPALALLMFTAPVLEIVFRETFLMGTGALRIMLLGQLVFALTGPCGPTLMMTGHQRVSLASLLTVLPVFAFAPWAATNLGLEGVAMIFAVAVSVQNLIQWIVVGRLLGIATQPCFSPGYILRLVNMPQQRLSKEVS